ncbi:MAG: HNH endonuclease signature motif containing protein [Candidatus Poribacteria bacterium]|nr:HNH endonuclease signature motif containing protein [Candidatus Poribacteria bacterium]
MRLRSKVPAELKRRVLCEAGHRCAIPACREIIVEVHHIVPWSKCKEHNYENLIALCPNCHRLADRGHIDQKSLKIYKANLRYAHDKFSQLEFDILSALYKEPENVSFQFPSFLMILIKRILDAEYVEVKFPENSVQILGMEMKPGYLFLTDKGREYIDSLGVDQEN